MFLGLARLIQLLEKHLGADETVTSKIKHVSCLWVFTVYLLQVRFHSFIVLIPIKSNDNQQRLGVNNTLTYRKGVCQQIKEGLKVR